MTTHFAELFSKPIDKIKLNHGVNDIDLQILLLVCVGNVQEVTTVINHLLNNKLATLNEVIQRLDILNTESLINLNTPFATLQRNANTSSSISSTEDAYIYLYLNLAQNREKRVHYDKLLNNLDFYFEDLYHFIVDYIWKDATNYNNYYEYASAIFPILGSKEIWQMPLSNKAYQLISNLFPMKTLYMYYYGRIDTLTTTPVHKSIKNMSEKNTKYHFQTDVIIQATSDSFFNLINMPISINYLEKRQTFFNDKKNVFSLTSVIDCLIVKKFDKMKFNQLSHNIIEAIGQIDFAYDYNVLNAIRDILNADTAKIKQSIKSEYSFYEQIKFKNNEFCHILLCFHLLNYYSIRESKEFDSFKKIARNTEIIKNLLNNTKTDLYIRFIKRLICDLFEIESDLPKIFEEIDYGTQLLTKLNSIYTPIEENKAKVRLVWVIDHNLQLLAKIQNKNAKGWTKGRKIHLEKVVGFFFSGEIQLSQTDKKIIYVLAQYIFVEPIIFIDQKLLLAIACADNVFYEDGTPLSFIEQKKLLLLENKADSFHIRIFPTITTENQLSNENITLNPIASGVYSYDLYDNKDSEAFSVIASTPSIHQSHKPAVIDMIRNKLDYYDLETQKGSIELVKWDKRPQVWLKIVESTLSISIRHQSMDAKVSSISGKGDEWIEISHRQWAHRDLTAELADVKRINTLIGNENKANVYDTDIEISTQDITEVIDKLTGETDIVFHLQEGASNIILKNTDLKIEINKYFGV